MPSYEIRIGGGKAIAIGDAFDAEIRKLEDSGNYSEWANIKDAIKQVEIDTTVTDSDGTLLIDGDAEILTMEGLL
jgi:uncharacterized Zn ribbon protein